jgi:hypothetical protein
MKPKFQTLSQRLLITRPACSPAEVLRTILLGMVQHLGPTVVGHAKAVARVDGGIVHASTTGVPPTVEVKTIDCPVSITDCLQLDLLCVFHGVTRTALQRAWNEVRSLLLRDGFHITALEVTPPSGAPQRTPARTRVGIALSMLPSVFVLKPCCVLPVLGSVFGGSLGLLPIFAPFEPYRPLFMIVSMGLLGSAFYRLYLHPETFPVAENASSLLTSHILFWVASSLFVIAALSPMVFSHTF